MNITYFVLLILFLIVVEANRLDLQRVLNRSIFQEKLLNITINTGKYLI
jgi:hypothetical protein